MNNKIKIAAVLILLFTVFGLTPKHAPIAQAATILSATNESMELVTATAGTITVTASFIDFSSSAATPNSAVTAISTATTTTIIAAPSASTQRQLKGLTVDNSGSASVFVTLQKRVAATAYPMFSIPLGAGETLRIPSDGSFEVYDVTGALKISNTSATDGTVLNWYKIGATSEAAGLLQMQAKDTGYPGTWVPGTPGVNGDALDCSIAADAVIAGAPQLNNPSTGSYYLTSVNAAGTVAEFYQLADLIWYNTGLTVTTTTSQTFTPPTLPNRDRNGTNNGDDWQAAIYVTTATTNAGAVTNATLQYTASDGTTSRNATMASFPATAVAGAFIPFQLQAGDRGIRTITGITLGTSLVTGSISVVLYRPLANVPAPAANVGGSLMPLTNVGAGPKIWNGTCFWQGYLASATTAVNSFVSATLVTR